MNEKIKQLCEQAGFSGEGFHNTQVNTCQETALKNFAELIVKECVGVVEGGHFLHDQAPTALFAKECSGTIKRHFGVEE
jgi:hypothetical protein